MGARYYSPAWHRFISPDGGADPAGPNQYAYVGGRVFGATDPGGLARLDLDGPLKVEIQSLLDDGMFERWLADVDGFFAESAREKAIDALIEQLKKAKEFIEGFLQSAHLVDRDLNGMPFPKSLPTHQLWALKFEKGELVVESTVRWFLKNLAGMDSGPNGAFQHLLEVKAGGNVRNVQNYTVPSGKITLEMVFDRLSVWNAKGHWYRPRGVFPSRFADDCQTFAAEFGGWLKLQGVCAVPKGADYDSARPR